MILMSSEIMKALDSEKANVMYAEQIDLDVFSDIRAGESIIGLYGKQFGVLRFERKVGNQAKAWLIEME